MAAWGSRPYQRTFFRPHDSTPQHLEISMRTIKTSYSKTTPESAEHGDTSETGWIDEQGYEIEFDESEGESAVSEAVKFLRRAGAIHASSSGPWQHRIWYSTGYQIEDYSTCTDIEKSFHLDGFTPDEEKAIFDELDL